MNWEPIFVALIGTLGLVQVALINRTRQHSKATREQTENNHDAIGKVPNLRDNIDLNQSEIVGLVREVLVTQNLQGRQIGRLFDLQRRNQQEIDDLETTQEKRNRNV